MMSKIDRLSQLFSEELTLFLSISLGVFLFILFFKPFPIERFDLDNMLLFVAGFGAIVFFIMFFIRIAFPSLIRNYYPSADKPELPLNTDGLLILVLSSVAFTFYLRYVGFVSITFYIVFKIVLICIAPPSILWIYDTKKALKQHNALLPSEQRKIRNRVEKYEEDYLNRTIEFNSDYKTEIPTLLIADIAIIKSADNYVEIVYKQDDSFKKSLIRNTLKNIELQLKEYPNFFRCHRICIINLFYIEKLNKNFNGYWLTIKGYEEQIPVSRQYLLKLKNAL